MSALSKAQQNHESNER